MNRRSPLTAVALIGLIVGCQHDAKLPAADKSKSTTVTPMPDFEYYTGSDAESDYFAILHGPQNREFFFARDRDPDRSDRMPRTKDRSQWRLVPGSAAP